MGGSSSGGANASAWPPITSGEPLTVPEEQWTWVPFSDTRCGNGTPAGIAVNRSTQSNNVVIYLSGGGACWDAASCFALETSIHFIHGVDENVTLQEAQAISNTFYFNRSEPANPLKDASYVYVPYCTGDLHSGNRSVTYQVFFEQKPGHHVGWTNMRSFLARIGPTFPNAQRVWIAGSSAGGYGAAFHWHHARQVFPNARVDLLNDSAPLINAWEVYGTWRGAWNMQYPEGCTNCRQSFVELFKHAAATAPAGSRQALLTSLQDQTLALYFGVGGPDLEARVRLLLAEYSAASGAHAFVEAGNGHVMLTAPAAHRATDMTELPAWLQAFFSDDANWGAAGY